MLDETASVAASQPGINLRSVPKTQISWPTAFRLRPASLPDRPPLAQLASDVEALTALKDITSPACRHAAGRVPLGVAVPPGAAQTVLSAFSTSLPDWRFVAGQTPHMLLSDSLDGATAMAAEVYSQFMEDTAQGPSTLSFAVERFGLVGHFYDVSDTELFPACYDKGTHGVPQRLLADTAAEGADGLIFSVGDAGAAVVLKPVLISRFGVERALALEWDGSSFTRAYDYRDMYWRSLKTL